MTAPAMPWTRPRFLLRLIVVVGVIQIGGTVLASHHQQPVRAFDWLGYALLAAPVVCLVGLRRTTVGVLAAVFTFTLLYWSLGYPRGPVFISLIVSFGAVVLAGHRRVALATMATGWVLFLWCGYWIGNEDAPGWRGAIALATWLAVLWSVFEVARSRHERGFEARRLEEEAQRRRVADERLRIAQDLHDSVAHSMSLINIQAGVALHLIDEQPEHVREALATIKQASRDALVELRSIVGVLRQDGENAPRSPTPSCASRRRAATSTSKSSTKAARAARRAPISPRAATDSPACTSGRRRSAARSTPGGARGAASRSMLGSPSTATDDPRRDR
jgi:signal transduction histidine kinase